MEAVERHHPVAPEELMAYLDGELESVRALSVHAHLAECGSCGALATEFRQTSRDLKLWTVPLPDHALQAPTFAKASSSAKASEDKTVGKPSPEPRWLSGWLRTHPANAWVFTGAAVMIVVCAGLWSSSALRNGPPIVQGPAAVAANSATAAGKTPTLGGRTEATSSLPAFEEPVAGQVSQYLPHLESERPMVRTQGQVTAPRATDGGQKIIRTVNMTIVPKQFDTVRETLDRLLRDVGGFVGGMQVSDGSSGRSLRATLRVPAARLDETIRSLRTLGHVVDESQSGQDATEQVRDIEARLTNSRNTEKRLTEVLKNRTGRVSDVLEVEREIARVREEIERMEAQRLNVERQVEYATLTVQVLQQRQATLDLGPTPVRTQLRNASVEGLKNAYETVVAALVWFLSVGPFMLLWAALLWWPARIAFRMVRGRATVT